MANPQQVGIPRKDAAVFEVSQVIQALFNPNPNKWLGMNGQDVSTGAWPELAAQWPCGVFTSTARTLAAGPAGSAIAADSTNFLLPGAIGTSPLQASPTGASGTWSTAATWGAGSSVTSLIKAGSRFIAAGPGGDFLNSGPYFAAIDQTAANIVAKSNWTAATNSQSVASEQCLAYSSSLGRAVMARDTSLSTAAGLFYINDASTTLVACSGGSTMTRGCITWSGKNFVAMGIGNLYQLSSDGQTFTDAFLPTVSPVITSVASDENGTVVALGQITNINGTFYGALVSTDHGVTWEVSRLPAELAPGSNALFKVQYLNGRFFILTTYDVVMVSKDGKFWAIEPIPQRGIPGIHVYALAYKAGVFCGIASSVTSALTAVEDPSKFRVPRQIASYGSAAGYIGSNQFLPSYIRARS